MYERSPTAVSDTDQLSVNLRIGTQNCRPALAVLRGTYSRGWSSDSSHESVNV